MAVEFRITPGTQIIVAPAKSQFELEETVIVNVSYTADARGLFGPDAWTMYCEVYLFGKKFTSGGDQKFNAIGTTHTASTNLAVNCGKAPAEGGYDGYAVAKAHYGL